MQRKYFAADWSEKKECFDYLESYVHFYVNHVVVVLCY